MKISKRELLDRVTQLEERLGRLFETVDSHRSAQRATNKNYLEAIGGMIWRTQQGHARGLAFLSDAHLKNLIEHLGEHCPEELALVSDEIQRRAIDVEKRKEERKTKRRTKKVGR